MTSDAGDLQSHINKCRIHKQPFSIKNNSKDGLLLQVHHTVKDNNGDLVSCRFVHTAFNENGEQLAVVDHTGNMFIVDLSTQKFWMLPASGNCYCISYSTYRQNEILVGRSNCSLDIVNTDDGSEVGNLIGHKLPPTQISYATGVPYCLTVSSEEAIIWDLCSNSPLHQLSLHTRVSVKQGIFMPITNNILIRFQNGIIHIWKSDQFEGIQQVIQKDLEGKNIRSLAFTRNGRAMAVAGQSATISVFLVDTWSLMKIITLPDACNGVKHIEFIPQLFDGGANKILAVLTTGCAIHLIDIESHAHLKRIILPEGCISNFHCSNTGKYAVCLLKTGEVNVYYATQLLIEQQTVSVSDLTFPHNKSRGLNHRNRIRAKQQLTKIHQRINTALDLQHLKPILQEFGEYPESFRPLIWKTLLQLPKNQDAYVSLVNKGLHMSVVSLDKTYPLQNKYVLNSVKRLLSCLVHWCPLLAEAKYLPVFVLPFVKLFKSDQFVCFEVVLSIIVNWCQFWFEFFPFPPANVLIIIENLISEHDFELLQHFYKYNVTPVLYAWSILETAFSEVVRGRTWLQLWDHILSNHPAFLLVVVAALNIMCHTTLLKLTDTADFEAFYHSDIIINITTLISKAYDIWSKTQTEYHPKKLFKLYQPLVRGNIYQMFHGYPRSFLDKRVKELNTIRDEQKSLLSDHQKIIKTMDEQEHIRQKEREVIEQQAKLKDLEEAYRTVIKQEEDRIAEQRKKLGIMQTSLRDQQKQMLHESCLRSKRHSAIERLAELEKLIDNIDEKLQEAEKLKDKLYVTY